MSQTVDQRVVQMKFDNAQFENGAKTTLGTLDKLKNALSFKGASDSLNELQNAGKRIDFSGVSDAVDSVSVRFSALQIAGITALQNITNYALGKFRNVWNNTIGQIISGGQRRALNIEQANFSMRGIFDGLYHDATVVEQKVYEVMKDGGPVQDSVDQTAFGLDQAAVAASNLLATGMDIEQLRDPLKVISGLASQTGKSYEMMADIVNDAYAKTYVSGMEISRLQESGINAIAELQRYYKEIKGLDYSTDQISKMITQKKISAEDFTQSLIHFYANAKRANDTYSGSLSNLKAALSRVGVKFYEPHFKNMTKIFNAFRIAVNALNAKALGPLFNIINSIDSAFTKIAVSIADFISNYFGFNQKIRNDLGRTSEVIPEMRSALLVLIDEFKHVFETIKESVNTIAEPFRKALIFINGTKDALDELKLDPSFKKSEKTIKQFAETIKNIKTFFKAFLDTALDGLYLFNELWTSIFRTFSSKIVPIFIRVVGIVSKILTPILNAVSNIGEIILEYRLIPLIIEKIGDVLVGVIEPVITWIEQKLKYLERSGFVAFLNKIVDQFRSFASVLEETLSNGSDFSFVGDKIVSIFEKINGVLTSVVLKIKGFIDSVKEYGPLVKFQNVLNKIYNVLAPYGTAIKSFAKNLKENLGFNNVTDFAGLIALVVDGGILYKLFDWFIKLRDIKNQWYGLFGLKEGWEKIYNILDRVRGSLLEFQREIKSKIIRNIAVSLLMIAGALLVLSMIDSKKLIGVTSVLTVMLLELFTSLQFFLGMTKSFIASSTLKSDLALYLMGSFFIKLAATVLILSVALKIIASIETERLEPAVIALTAIMFTITALVAAMVTLNSLYGGSLKSCTKGLISLSIAIGILAGVVKILGSMDQGQLERGINALSNIVLIVGLFMGAIMLISSYTMFSGGNMFKGIISMAISMLILTKVIEKLGSLDINVLTTGIEALGAIMIILGIFMTMSNNYGSATISLSLIAIAASLLIFQKAIEKLGEMPFENLIIGLLAMLSIFTAITAMFIMMPKDARVLATAAALLIMGIALNTFALALKLIASIPFTSLIKSIGAIVVVLGIFAGLAFVFGSMWQILLPGVGIIVALAGAMALFGAGMLAAAVAITIVSPLLVAFAANFILAARVILRGIGELGSDLIIAIATIITSIFAAIRETIPDLLETLTVLLDAFLTFFEDNISRLVETGYKLVMGLLDGLTEKMPEIIDAGFNVLIAFLEGLGTAFDERGEELGEAAGKLITGLISGLWDAAVGLWEELKEFARQVIEDHFGVDLTDQSLVDVGKDLIQGLWNGFLEKTREFLDSLWDWGAKLVGRVKDATGVKSPSWMFKEIGEYCMEGMAIGLSNVTEPMKAVDESADSILSAFRSTMSSIEDVINSDMNMQPTVTPVLDLSQIQNGVSTMNGMLGLTNGMTASISGKLSAMRSHQAENDLKAIAETIKKANDVPTVNMTVYGAQGQDVRELAEIVSNRIQHQLSRREMALG